MPLSVEKITPDTSLANVRSMINDTIQYLIDREGKTPKEAAGQAYGMAEQQWGKPIPKTG